MSPNPIAPAAERSIQKMNRISPRHLTFIIVLLYILVFLLDIFTKVGQAAGVYYVVPIADHVVP